MMTKTKKSAKKKIDRNSNKKLPQMPNYSRIQAEQSNPRVKKSGSALDPNGQVWLFGTHAVEAALGNSRRKKYRLLVNQESATTYKTEENEIEPEYVSRQYIESKLPLEAVHQGVALLVAPLDHMPIETICKNATDKSVIIVLDQVTDPRNIGAIMRSAIAFGASSLIVPDRHTPETSASMAKAASGAADLLPIVRVRNLARSLVLLKKAGFWLAGLDAKAQKSIAETNLNGKLAIILGSEGSGLRRLTAQNCDYLINIPMDPSSGSLNVSVAASIALYEIYKNRNI